MEPDCEVLPCQKEKFVFNPKGNMEPLKLLEQENNESDSHFRKINLAVMGRMDWREENRRQGDGLEGFRNSPSKK